jgi:hypothetical protein
MDAIDRLSVSVDVNRVINLAQVTVYPTETAGSVQVIWTARTILHIAPASTRIIYANYRDDNGERVGATDVQNLAPFTDYTYEYNGIDVTSWGVMTVTATIEATRVKLELENTSGWATLDVTLLQVRGKPIRVYDPITLEKADATSQTAYEVRAQRLDLPMQSDLALAQSYMEYLVGRFADPVLVADSFVIEDRPVVEDVNIFSLELFDKVDVSDDQSGMSSAGHWIRAVEYDLKPGSSFAATFHLERADDEVYCFLDVTGYCELDSVKVGF